MLEPVEQSRVGVGKSVIVELVRSNPGKSQASARFGFVALPDAAKEFQVNGFLRIVVRDGFDQLAHRHINPEFFLQFPAQACLKRLVGVPFPTRKFPQPAEVRVRRTQRDQKLSIAKNQTGGDI
jgi:hypothetical protein